MPIDRIVAPDIANKYSCPLIHYFSESRRRCLIQVTRRRYERFKLAMVCKAWSAVWID